LSPGHIADRELEARVRTVDADGPAHRGAALARVVDGGHVVGVVDVLSRRRHHHTPRPTRCKRMSASSGADDGSDGKGAVTGLAVVPPELQVVAVRRAGWISRREGSGMDRV